MFICLIIIANYIHLIALSVLMYINLTFDGDSEIIKKKTDYV